MKKLVSLMLIIAMLLCLPACDEAATVNEVPIEDAGNVEVSTEAVMLKEDIIPFIAQGQFDKAYNKLEEYFTDHSVNDLDADGEYLFPYYMDLTVLIQMASISPDNYHIIFQSFRAPETFISAMIHYPYSAKKYAYTRKSTLVLTAESSDVSFSKSEMLTEDEINEISLAMGDFESGEKREVYVDGREYTVIIYKTTEGYYKIWDTTTEDESSYMMRVEEWDNLLP